MRPINEERMTKTLQYILEYQKSAGKTPTYRQIQDDCHYSTLATVAADVARLKARGLIESDNSSGWNSISLPSKLNANGSHNSLIVGAVHCGQPSPAIEDIEAAVTLPDAIFGSADHIILHAVGPSMIKRGIFNGDLLVVRRQNTAKLGQTIIAMLEDGETTCKILAKNKKGQSYLRAANDTLLPNGERMYDVHPDKEWTVYGVVDFVIHAPLRNEL